MSRSFPSPLTTDRLTLRFPTLEDADELNRAICESWDRLHEWMAWATIPPSLDETRRRCAAMVERAAAGTDFPLYGFEGSTLILAAGVQIRDAEVPSYEIGFWCREGFEGRGYVSEAVRALVGACFGEMEARRVELRCDSRNARSRAVAERCGFRLEGELVSECRFRGELRTTAIYAIVRND